MQRMKAATNNQEETISRLPDEILEVILSQLTIEEAARTSVLSTRWRYLWTFFSGNLDFNCSLTVEEIDRINAEREIFIRRTNLVLKSLQNASLDGLRICFDLNGAVDDVDGWVKFAIQKKIKKLELDLSSFHSCDPEREANVIASLLNFTSLHVLYLEHVDVSGKNIEHLLSYCPFLETLAVVYSKHLSSLIVSGPSLKLKQLEIRRCFALEVLEISAENLVSFTYQGPKVNISYKSVPNLQEVSLSGLIDNKNFVVQELNQLSSLLLQLKVVTFKLYFSQCCFKLPGNFTRLINVKELDMFMICYTKGCLDSCLSLLNFCPSLRVFIVKLKKIPPSFEVSNIKFDHMEHRHECLKELRVFGFSGDSDEIEFVKCIVKNATNLEKVIIDPFNINPGRTDYRCKDDSNYLIRRTRAQDIVSSISPWVELDIL